MRLSLVAPAALLALAACLPDLGAEPAPRSIPEALRGNWGLTAADCRGGAAAKGLIVVEAQTVRFYESRATLADIHDRSATRIRAGFAFTGEGQEWRRDMSLDAQQGGTTLIRRDHGEGAMPGPLEYRRCG